ncbi:GH-E family nuclease [Xanthovirga aplysinae]|uniref:GH-E family nuclease n=1 Tax=Xanthovirga aplysinae TaxID=2529853 RepID=UPI0012BD1238|nr:GH-E family nuclease [Xanthovirga aplysinae]MTI32632.1 hypothetical protein [Xanthovirga aplysinae]
MRRNYFGMQLALPPGIYISVQALQDNNQVDQDAVDRFVDGLHRRPDWYKNEYGLNSMDTRLYMLEKVQPFRTINIQGKLTRAWKCDNCMGTVLYEGLHIGHIKDWKRELKDAGVLNAEEAKAAYNNLNNLRIECSTCNTSHDWE